MYSLDNPSVVYDLTACDDIRGAFEGSGVCIKGQLSYLFQSIGGQY